jgi:death-on-curing protein
MAGSLLRSLAENQPFTDGNKRTAWAAAMVFLEINGVSVEAAEDQVVQMMLSVAAKELDVAGIAEFLEEHATHAPAGSGTPRES